MDEEPTKPRHEIQIQRGNSLSKPVGSGARAMSEMVVRSLVHIETSKSLEKPHNIGEHGFCIPADCEVAIGLQSSRKTGYFFGGRSYKGLPLFGRKGKGELDDFVKSLVSSLARELTSNNKVFGFYFCNDSGTSGSTHFEPLSTLTSQEWATSCLLPPWKPGRWHRMRDTLEVTIGPHRSKNLRILVLVIYESTETDLFVGYLRKMIQRGDAESPWRTLVTVVAPYGNRIRATYFEDYDGYDDIASSLLVIPGTLDVDDVMRAIQTKLAKIG